MVEYISEGHKLAWPSNIQYFSELQSALEIIQYIKAVSILFPQPLAVFFVVLSGHHHRISSKPFWHRTRVNCRRLAWNASQANYGVYGECFI